ncbi:hypothetical protein BV25DRAFT_1822154 [Artomyces pyxidatus]|uniref:Uncharacterized protein n=1 Tax=Artomyces pyxidatus TaxID=48021 RepID=A0ACB8TA47_9AGAM|nr:hypothetical protein BV25DRAFT_1822154 [Artomyces pyxidatus]
MGASDLPAEILTYIFELAVEDDALFESSHPTSLSESHWHQKAAGEAWNLMNPNDIFISKQRKNYTMSKAIIFTCRQWYRFGYHLLFRSLYLSEPSKLPSLCFALDRHSWLGWYVRRLHLVRYYAPRSLTITHIEQMLVSVIHQCPNLELFTVEWPITLSFSSIANALTTFSSQTLRSIQWTIAPTCLPRLIWALASLPGLVSAQLDFGVPAPSEGVSDEASILLGASSELELSLPCLTQLTVRGVSQDFLEQAAGWSLPVLQSFTLDFAANRSDVPDVVDFLTQHGAQLTFLDLNTIPAIDISAVLAACPLLKTFCFNPDWRLPFHTEAADPAATPTLLHAAHPHITHIGLHQLLHAFLPSKPRELAQALPSVATYLIQRTNDLTFGQLTRRFFPALQVIRVLNRTLLKGLEKNDGPEEEGLERWERWYEQCKAQGVRLEDCTGALLGDLPINEPGEDDYIDELEDEEYAAEAEKVKPKGIQPSNVNELRSLLDEIRRMTVVEDESFSIPMTFLQS